MKHILTISKAINLRSAMEFQGKGDIRYYLNGIHLAPAENKIESTNGHVACQIFDSEFTGLKAKEKSLVIAFDRKALLPAKGDDWTADLYLEKDGITGIAIFKTEEGLINKPQKRITTGFQIIELEEGKKFPDVNAVFKNKEPIKTEVIGINIEYMKLIDTAFSRGITRKGN